MELQFNSIHFHGASAFVRIKEQFELWRFHCTFFPVKHKTRVSEFVLIAMQCITKNNAFWIETFIVVMNRSRFLIFLAIKSRRYHEDHEDIT